MTAFNLNEHPMIFSLFVHRGNCFLILRREHKLSREIIPCYSGAKSCAGFSGLNNLKRESWGHREVCYCTSYSFSTAYLFSEGSGRAHRNSWLMFNEVSWQNITSDSLHAVGKFGPRRAHTGLGWCSAARPGES